MEGNSVSKKLFQRSRWLCLIFFTALDFCPFVYAKWQPIEGPLMTQWAPGISPNNVLVEYPRPQMVREDWLNLNGLWEYAIRPKDQQQPEKFDGQILVPFAVESALSGVMKSVGQENCLWYRRTFEIPESSRWNRRDRRILLNFGAVDWDTTVWINGNKIGNHKGGYDPFSFDITDALSESGQQEIVVSVWDPTDDGTQPRGKQVRRPNGIWYTAVTGIWQSVWIEPVPRIYIKSIEMIPDIDAEQLRLRVNIEGIDTDPNRYSIFASIPDLHLGILANPPITSWHDYGAAGEELVIPIPNPILWSPDSPYLYELNITIHGEEYKIPGQADNVDTYFAMRKIEVKKDGTGINRLFLNDKPLFQYGPLDQGWWPDGLYTAPTDEALKYDIEVIKKLGMNMVRKHVKVEPARWYCWCDKLGLMVWQDMPNGDRHIGRNDVDLRRSEESSQQFELELKRVIEAFRNHPCIVMWVPFNEGWGQYDTERITSMVKQVDPTRLVNNASGWADRSVGDVHDIHRYPGPDTAPPEDNRAVVLGEFGGLGLPVKGHTWQDEKNWGYRSYETHEELTNAYLGLIDSLRSLISGGLSAAVYTQITDVEIEVNGLMTYDRAIIKMDSEKIAAANELLSLPRLNVKTIIPVSQQQDQIWRYTISEPEYTWSQNDFDDSAWNNGPGGFGTEGSTDMIVRTKWETSDIWLRQMFKLNDIQFTQPQLLLLHDGNAEVYINGWQVAKVRGSTSSYLRVKLDENTQKRLNVGLNCLAIHCSQTSDGQYIDAGLVDIIGTAGQSK